LKQGDSAQLLHRVKLEVLVDRNLFLNTANALDPAIPLPLLGHADRVSSSSLRKRAWHAVGSAIDFAAVSAGMRGTDWAEGMGRNCNSEVEKK
jgi:hypothetical protein